MITLLIIYKIITIALLYFIAVLSLNEFSNELEQFLYYERLTPYITNASTNGITNDHVSLFQDWSDCVDDVSQNWMRKSCHTRIIDKIRDNIIIYEEISKINRKVNPVYNDNRLLPNCSYEVIFDRSSYSVKGNVYFVIKQLDCVLFGGGSFEILVSNIYHQSYCQIRDLFNGYYYVYCPLLPVKSTERNKEPMKENNRCFQITVILDYEHFDAFSEVYARNFPIGGVLFSKNSLCIHKIIQQNYSSSYFYDYKTNMKTLIKYLDTYTNYSEWFLKYNITLSSNSLGKWLRRYPSAEIPIYYNSSNCINSSKCKYISDHYPGLFDYSWTGKGNTIPNKIDFKKYFLNSSYYKTHFIGSSHMRYNWDYFDDIYFSSESLSKLTRKHEYSALDGLDLYSRSFITDVGDIFNAYTCPKANDSKTTYVIQSGSWDLDLVPIRAYIRNPKNSLHFLKQLEIISQLNCSIDRLKFILVGTMTPGGCRVRDTRGKSDCKESLYHRNAYAIKAADTWILNNLKIYNQSSSIFHFIDPHDIIKPRLRSFELPVCINHWLCHPGGTTMLVTSPGMIVANEILIQSVWSDSNANTSQPINNHADILFVVLDLSSTNRIYNISYYIVEGNLRRQIPDEITYIYIKNYLSPYSYDIKYIYNQMEYNVFLSIYPYLDVVIPSRSDKYIIQSQYASSVKYKLRNGMRCAYNQSNNVNSKIIESTSYDLNNIPFHPKC